MNDDFLKKYDCKDNVHSLVIEDNGKVAYAYLLKDEQVVGDVWLYNKCPTPSQPEWEIPGLMPFANSKGFIREISDITYPPESDQSFDIKWNFDLNRKFKSVYIYLNNQFFAKISTGDKPGYCILAKKDGPLAKKLEKNDN